MTNNTTYLKVKDHSVSGEEFKLCHDPYLGLLQTTPQPSEDILSQYYKSEDYISHTDSKRNLFEKAYHLVRNISLKRKLTLINSLSTEHKKLLDVGCGTGDFLQVARRGNWSISGIEPDENARAIANIKTKNAVTGIEQLLEFNKHEFDVITLWHVLEHLPNLERQVALLKSLLKPNGRLIIAVPNYKSYDAEYYKEFWAAYDVPRHLWHFSQSSIQNLFGTENMIVDKTLPMKFDAFYVSLLSEKYRSGWMNVFRAFFVGLHSNLKARTSGEYSSLIYVIKNRQNQS